jgi:outer membrane cobalamin receptor
LCYSALAAALEADQLAVVEVEGRQVQSSLQTPGDLYWNREALLQSGQFEISRILRAQPGIDLSQGMRGGMSVLDIRGASSGAGLVNIDGIPLHETIPGAFALDLLPAEMFDGMTVRKGSASLLDFGRSLGGSVNLHSQNTLENGGKLHVEGGSFGTLREIATGGLGNDDHRLKVVAGRNDLFDGTHWADSQEGNSERDDFHSHQFSAHVTDRFSERVRLDSSLYYIDSDMGGDKVGLIKPTPEFANVDDPGWLKQSIWLAQSTAQADLHPHWRSALQLGYTRHQVGMVLGGILPGQPPNHIGFDNRLSLARWKNSHFLPLASSPRRSLNLDWGTEGLYEQGRSLNTNFSDQRGTGSGFAHLQANWDDWQPV